MRVGQRSSSASMLIPIAISPARLRPRRRLSALRASSPAARAAPTMSRFWKFSSALDGQPPLLTGMRVDVFFKADGGQQSAVLDVRRFSRRD